MNKYQKISIFVMIGFPLFFLIVSLITGKWGFFFWSLLPSFISGITGLIALRNSNMNLKK
ncbi:MULTISPECIES: hypothetical protein [Parageobacillus]|jgi:uncharacterized membrane protein|uniref:Uncharacterized protein n=1 Tax=Parageobacillus thermoglucosidasius TaxID=1426 RepID=A0A1B7KMW5_PARTM|nr:MULTISPECIES: hypothetical protein [Parageobacillus]OAT71421.1 hypothetical protein A7K69_15220 [Parageobacillus thermoglucosidasius]BDG48954.1 hypothetical protein PspKH34_35150 [Parageobacillus sp. KH3-4]